MIYFSSYADDNIPLVITDNIQDVIRSLEEVGENLISWILTNVTSFKILNSRRPYIIDNLHIKQAIFLEKEKTIFIKTIDLKITCGFELHCNLNKLVRLYLFFVLNRMELSFRDVFVELLFLYAASFLPETVSTHHHRNTHHLFQKLSDKKQEKTVAFIY